MWLVIGSGQKGLDWAKEQKGQTVVCLDSNPLLSGEYVVGDILTEDLQLMSIRRIYADFLLNAVFPGGVSMAEVIEWPDILSTSLFPAGVQDWYKRGRAEIRWNVTAYLEDLRWKVREEALGRMWRALKQGGEIVVVDRKEIVSWAGEKLRSWGGKVAVGEVDEDDYRRSVAKSMELDRKGQFLGMVGKLVVSKV